MGLEHIDLSKFRRAGAPSPDQNGHDRAVGPDLGATLGFIDEQTGQLEEQKRQKEAQERKKPYRPANMGDFFDLRGFRNPTDDVDRLSAWAKVMGRWSYFNQVLI